MAGKKKKKFGLTGMLMAIIFAFGAVMMMPSTMVFVIGMVPTAVALFSDTSKAKTAGTTIGPINFAGVLVPLLELWQRGHTVDIAMDIIAEPMMLLFMYGAAGIGAFLYMNLPPLIGTIIRRQAKNRVEKIEKTQKEMIKTWGQRLLDAADKK